MTVETSNDVAPVENSEESENQTSAPVPAETKETKPKETQAEKEAKAEAKRRYKLKINGTEREYDEDSVVAMAQRGAAADEKFQKAAAKAKRVEELYRLAKEDPDAVLAELTGMDPMEIHKARIRAEIDKMSMTPEQRELAEAKAKIEAFEKKEKERQEKEKQTQLEKATQFYVSKYDKEIPEQLKAVGLPVNEDTVRYTAEIMLANLEEGYELPYPVVMDLVKDRFHGTLKKFLSSQEREYLAELLGEDTLKKLMSPKKGDPTPKQAIQDGADPMESETKFETPEEFRERVRKWSSS